MLKYVILAAILLLVVVLIVLAVRGIIQAIHDNVVIHRYNSKMNEIRKERIWQEKEKQRRIRGESEDAPKYAAGDKKDRINRQSYYELQSNETDEDFTIIIRIVVTLIIALIITAITTLF